MRISVKVKTKSRFEKVEKQTNGSFVVFVKSVPEKGKANEAVIKLLADYFKAPRSNIRIVKGSTSKNKILEI